MKQLLLICAACVLLAAACNAADPASPQPDAQLQQQQLQQACAAQAEPAAHAYMTTLPFSSTLTGQVFHYSHTLSKCLVEVKAVNRDSSGSGAAVYFDALIDANSATHPLIDCDRHFDDPSHSLKITDQECVGPDSVSSDAGWAAIMNEMNK